MNICIEYWTWWIWWLLVIRYRNNKSFWIGTAYSNLCIICSFDKHKGLGLIVKEKLSCIYMLAAETIYPTLVQRISSSNAEMTRERHFLHLIIINCALYKSLTYIEAYIHTHLSKRFTQVPRSSLRRWYWKYEPMKYCWVAMSHPFGDQDVSYPSPSPPPFLCFYDNVFHLLRSSSFVLLSWVLSSWWYKYF